MGMGQRGPDGDRGTQQRQATQESVPPWQQPSPQQSRPQEQPNNTGTGASAPERLADADAAGPLLHQGGAGGEPRRAPRDETEPPHETEPPGDGDEEEDAARRTLRSLFGRDEE